MTTPQLYEHIITDDGTSQYMPYYPKHMDIEEIETSQMITLLIALTAATIMSVEQEMPKHALVARKLRAVEQALLELGYLNNSKLDPDLVEIGVNAFNQVMVTMTEALSGGKKL